MFLLGIDPGPVAGLLRLDLEVTAAGLRLRHADALQVTPGALIEVLEALGVTGQFIAMERYVIGRRSARSATPAAGAITRDMVGGVQTWAARSGTQCVLRAAAEVKPWAVDKRLHAAGLLDLTAGMRHARDGGRHALFAAVKDHGLTDPISSKAGAR